MKELLDKLKGKILDLENLTGEVQNTYQNIIERVASVEFPVNQGDSLKEILVNIVIRLDAVEKELRNLKQ